MSMIDLNNYNKALKISWMQRALFDKCSTCTALTENQCNIILNTGGHIGTKLINKLNPFWKEVAHYWNEFLCKLERPTDTRHILAQSVWNNAFFRNKECFNNKWYNLGIRNICNIVNDNGQIKSLSELKTQFNIDENFLLYNTIIVNIPKEWKNALKNECSNVTNQETCSPIKEIIEKAKNGSRLFYDCLASNKEQPSGHVKWERKFINSTLPWNKYHELNKNVIPDTRTRSFQYKIYHHILPTNTMLQKIGLKNSDQCTFCRNAKETIEHIIVNCSFSELFWDDLELYISQKLDKKLKLSIQEKLFGALEENKTINHILTLARKHIYYSRQKDLLPNMKDFLQYLQKIIKLETFSSHFSPNPKSSTEKWNPFV